MGRLRGGDILPDPADGHRALRNPILDVILDLPPDPRLPAGRFIRIGSSFPDPETPRGVPRGRLYSGEGAVMSQGRLPPLRKRYTEG